MHMDFKTLGNRLGIRARFDLKDHLNVGTIRKRFVCDQHRGVSTGAFGERDLHRIGALS